MTQATAAIEAAYASLQADPAIQALVGDDIFDVLPEGILPALYVSIGPDLVQEASDKTGTGDWRDFTVSVVTESSGFHVAKQVAGAISDVLDGASLGLSRGRLVELWFRKAKASREAIGRRRIDLTFRARVEDQVAS